MSCFYPRVAVPAGLTPNGKTKYDIIPTSTMVDPYVALNETPGSVLVPCGKCKGCRIDYSRQWADRMMLELETAGSAVFLTLTYDSDHVNWKYDDAGEPIWQTLNKRDWQLFMKSLRRYFEPKKIRFFCCGEYGEKTLRPHFHAIVFGIGLDAFSDLEQIGRNREGSPYYKSDSLYKIWSRGHVLLADVSWETCAYVARYVTKKTGNHADFLESIGVQPEFCIMSRRPGLGRQYLDLHPDALDYQHINISTQHGGRKIAIPRYYLKQLELTNPEKFANIKERRKAAASDSMYLKLLHTDMDFFDYFEHREQLKEMQTVPLLRNQL